MTLLSRLRSVLGEGIERNTFRERQDMIYLRAAELAGEEDGRMVDVRYIVRARKEVEEALEAERQRNLVAFCILGALASGLGLLVIFGCAS